MNFSPTLGLWLPEGTDDVADIAESIRQNGTTLDDAVLANDPRLLTAALQAALAGNGGTPGSGNKFVTETGLAASAGAGSEIGYDQITANVNNGSTTESAGTTVITCAAHTFDGSPVIAEFFAPSVDNGGNSTFIFSLFEGATQIGRLASAQSAGTWPVHGCVRFTPSAGSHTYKVTVHASSASGQVRAGAGGTGVYVPAFVRFTKV